MITLGSRHVMDESNSGPFENGIERLEWILGFHLRGATLLLDPCVPKARRNFEIAFRYHSARYDIAIENPHGVSRGVDRVEIDSKPLPGNLAQIPLVDDGMTHRVRVVLGVPMLSPSDALKAMASMDRGALPAAPRLPIKRVRAI